MPYEVEIKYPLGAGADPLPRLAELTGTRHEPVVQRDEYFAHPCRDFAQTDEALRIRSVGGHNALTWKGPLVDDRSKTREEVEVDLEPGSEAVLRTVAVFTRLGFRSVLTVEKTRTAWTLDWEGRRCQCCHDVVRGLGEFLELETLAGADDWQAARESLERLADRLGLAKTERRSYLELLLSQHRPPPTDS